MPICPMPRTRARLTHAWLACVALGSALASCSGPSAEVNDKATLVGSEPSLPTAAGRFAPAHTQLPAVAEIDGKHLSDVESCESCHPDVAAQWYASAHAFASFNNPIYRVSIQGFRKEVNNRASRFCAGCHDVAPLVDGLMDSELGPDDLRSHAGITCRMCHGISEVRPDGNGSFTLSSTPIPVPKPDDAESVEVHRKAVSRKALGSSLCLTCHRSFLGPETGNAQHLTGMDDYTAWQSSAHAGQGAGRVDDPVTKRDCIECHMTREPAPEGDVAAKDGTIASHRFLGGHTWLAAMRGSGDDLARVQAFLAGVASIDIATAISRESPVEAGQRTLPADGAPVIAGGELLFDVVVRNLGVGHGFPGGVRDAHDTWIEVVVRDAGGQILASSGLEHAREDMKAVDMDMDTGLDATDAHVFRSLVGDRHGTILFGRQVNRFGAGVVDHTIGPRDAAVVRYALAVPERVAEPLTIDARLRHRTRNLGLQVLACAESRSSEGQAFGRGSQTYRGIALDPCKAQPITTIAETRIWVGQGWQARADEKASAGAPAKAPRPPAWRRLYEHGMAWTHAVQERLDEARPSLEAALAALEAGAAAGEDVRVQTAMVLAMLGRVAGHQGRTDEALVWLDRAETLVPGHHALAAIRAEALTLVWRWQEAEEPLRRVVQKVPRNTQAWTNLAVALGSLGKDREALEAAQHGLVLSPRSEALLRVQALALRSLGTPHAGVALDAYDRFRAPDRAMDIRFACAAKSPACALEREPVHTHPLTPHAAR